MMSFQEENHYAIILLWVKMQENKNQNLLRCGSDSGQCKLFKQNITQVLQKRVLSMVHIVDYSHKEHDSFW